MISTLHSNMLIGCSTVIHLIGATTPASANLNMATDLEANVISTLHFLDACRHHNVKRVIFVSSGGTVYGIPNCIPTPESAPLEPITAYGVSKLAIERYLHLHSHLYGLDYVVLRVANPYGPYQTAKKGQGVIAAFISNALRGEPLEIWGDGSVVRDYLHVDDVVNAIQLAMNYSGASGIFNIGSGHGHSISEIASIIERVIGHPVQRSYLAARRIDVPRSVLDVSAAHAILGWRPQTDLQTGIRQTMEWMRRQSASNNSKL